MQESKDMTLPNNNSASRSSGPTPKIASVPSKSENSSSSSEWVSDIVSHVDEADGLVRGWVKKSPISFALGAFGTGLLFSLVNRRFNSRTQKRSES
jgi:hypothetical protein